MIDIYNTAGEVIFSSPTASNIKEALEDAVNQNINLSAANLYGEDLKDANLTGGPSGVMLAGACLYGACLINVIFSSQARPANLTGCDFYGADCANADFSYAATEGAKVAGINLAGAILTGVTGALAV